MKYLLSLIFILCLSATATAQTTIFEELQTDRPGQGTVNIHQDKRITALIGKCLQPSPTAAPGQNILKTRGFRIQVYAGNNSRVARNEAKAMAEEVKKAFPNMPVYTYFQPPRWLCRVGDFKSMEEAYDAMLKLKGCGKFKEVAIVRENINISLE